MADELATETVADLASTATPRPELDALALHPWTCRGEPTHRQTGPEWRCQKAAADLKVNLDAAWETGYHEGVRRASPATPEPCHVVPAFSQYEYAVDYCESHDQPASYCA